MEPGRSRGLKNGEHDPLEVAWRYTPSILSSIIIELPTVHKHFCCIISLDPNNDPVTQLEETILELMKSDNLFCRKQNRPREVK